MCSHNDAKIMRSRKFLAVPGVVSLLSMLLVFGGCMVGPNFVKPEGNLAENWSGEGDPRVMTQTAVDKLWWKVFKDPTLDQLIQLAYQQNLPLQIAGLRILESRARLGVAIGRQYPQQQEVFGGATGVGLSKNAANSFGSDRSFRDYQLGFDAGWELDFWGKFRREVEAAYASMLASVADYDDALVSLTAEVARTYTVIRTYEVLIKITSANAKVQEDGLKIAESRFRNGVTTELDVAQARTLLESTRSAIPQLQTSLQQAQNALSTLLGQPTGVFQELLNGHKGIPTAPPEVAVSVPAELLRRRPDIRNAELSAAAQCARVGIAQTELYPSFSLFGEIGFQSSSQGGVQSGNADFDNLWDADSFFYSFGPGVHWSIFNYGRIENNVRIQDARFQQSLVNYQDTVLNAAQEVEDAMTGFLKAHETAMFEQNSVNAAQRSVEIAFVQYREGAVDYQRVLDTQRALLQEENNLAQARSSIATNLIALYKALGGGWELRQGQPIIAESMQAEMQKRTNWGRLLPAPPAPETSNLLPPAQNIPILQKPQW
ncbi:MAG: efflux transporter outer membrane subunit [Methylococcaceae bacterium]|nr:efflux transporter outer membrane subunit [Methylococcaceae bacterium]